tara:strand:+ start:15360 stop:16349 length:990 start_codon:yes stop_codon:yes gene_type:complete
MNARKHPCSRDISQDIEYGDAVVFEDPDFTNGSPTLSEAEAAHFKEHGYVVKRGLLDEPETFERIVDYVWENVPRGICQRDDSETWFAVLDEGWTEEDEEALGPIKNGGWRMRSRGGIGTEPFLVDKIGNHPRMLETVSRFTGSPVKRLSRVRGVYSKFPHRPGTAGRLAPHADHIGSQLTAMVLVDEVPARCGGFTIWPGSHRLLHPHWDTVFGTDIGPDREDGYWEARDSALREIAPLEFPGHAGDVVFWHPRLIHSTGVNHSAELGRPILRLVVPCDYQRDGRTWFDDDEFGPGAEKQWWIDARNFREDEPATADNMWDAWAFETD